MNTASLHNGCHFLPGFFQIAYVTTDLERAMRTFDEQYGVKHYFELRDVAYDESTRVSIATAYAGDVMIELIEPKGTGDSIYELLLPNDGDFAIRHHHMGHLFQREEDLRQAVQLATRKGQAIAYEGGMEGVLKAVYIDTRDVLGHYLEYIHCTPVGLEFLNQAPRN